MKTYCLNWGDSCGSSVDTILQ